MNHVRAIVSAIDFSKPSVCALKEAHRIAAQDGAKLTAVHVFDEQSLDELIRHAEITLEEVLAEASRKLRIHLDEVLGEGHGAEADLVVGHPFEKLRDEADRLEADLIAMGSQGFGESPHRIGSLAARCLRKARQNVLLVRGRHAHPFRKIAACVDFSNASLKAARHAAHLARLDGAPLELFHVHQPVSTQIDFGLITYAVPLDESREQKIIAEKQAIFDEHAGRLASEEGISCTARIMGHSSVNQAIEEAFGDGHSDTDLLVVSTRGRTGLKWLLLGTVAEKVISTSPCSVLAIKPEGFDYRDPEPSSQ